MKVTAIPNPQRDERIVAVDPIMRPEIAADWRRRINLFTGRSLSDTALRAEQHQRGGRLSALAQHVSHGVVQGLEIAVERETGSEGDRHLLQITAGMGIAATGEDVHVPKLMRVQLNDLPIIAPVSILADEGEDIESDEAGALVARRLGPSLGDFLSSLEPGEDPLPHAGVIVLEPIVAELRGEGDPFDPCARDLNDDPFDDLQLVDGCRVALYMWPSEVLALPAPGARWRNRLAYAIFDRESAFDAGQLHPWQACGVPIGLVGFDASWQPLLVDRHSVVRYGGRPRRRTNLVANLGNTFLWQARLEQFAEHLATIDRTTETTLADLAAAFRSIPPVGLLPREALELNPPVRNRFFPDSYVIDAAPIPLEQLDSVFEASASLAPFDLDGADRVRVLVPVPQIWYEPELLQVETEHPDFASSVIELVVQRAEYLQRQEDVRGKASALARAISGEPLTFPDPDPDALEDEDVGTDPLDPVEEAFGTETGDEGLVAVALEALTEQLTGQGSVVASEVFVEEDGVQANRIEQLGVTRFIQFLQAKVSRADDLVDLHFARVQSDIYRVRQLLLGTTAASRLATSPVLAGIARGDSAIATREQINDYFEGTRPLPPDDGSPAGAAAGGDRPVAPSSVRVARSDASVPRVAASAAISTNFALRTTSDRTVTSAAASSRGLELPATRDPGRTIDDTRFKVPLDDLTVRAELTKAQQVSRESAGDAGAFRKPARRNDVVRQAPVVGKTDLFRTVTVGERLQDSPAREARLFGIATKHDTIQAIQNLEMNFAGVPVSGIAVFDTDGSGNRTPRYRSSGQLERTSVLFEEIDLQAILDDPGPRDGDEAAHSSAAVEILDSVVAMLRGAEGRIERYRQAVEACRATLNEIQVSSQQASRRLDVIDDLVAEARHDVAVARALRAEEQQRVQAINERRQRIRDEHVPFVAFVRPRVANLLRDTPHRPLDPGLLESPVPECLTRRIESPDELESMINVLRDAPARWFPAVAKLLDRLNRLDVLQNAMQTAVRRAQTGVAAREQVVRQQSGGRFGAALFSVFRAQQQVVAGFRARTAQANLAGLAAASWKQSRDTARDVLSLGDLIETKDARTAVPRRAAAELENVTRVASCLYVAFGQVEPIVRLDWAQRMSEHDKPVNLRNLSSLPRWGDIEFLDRYQLQMFVDWLYQRIDPAERDAVNLMNDVVRVCILLASHAPVSRILAGRVRRSTVVKVGGRVEVAVDLSKVRVGMQVLMYGQQGPVARAVVDDLSVDFVTARVVQTNQAQVTIEEGARVHVAESDGLQLNAATSRAALLGGASALRLLR